MCLLGGFRVWVGTRVVDDAGWRLRKARAVVKLLALAPGQRLHRDRLIELLWPDLGPEAAANNLRYALHVTRRALGGASGSATGAAADASADGAMRGATGGGAPAYLTTEDHQLALSWEGTVWTDVAAFEAGVAAARGSGDVARYQEAADLYSGDLLPEDRYEDWAAGRRQELRELYLALLLEQARLAEGAGAPGVATQALWRAIAAEPAHEEAHQALMRRYLQDGRSHQALRQYQQLSDALRRELDSEPDAVSQRLYHSILTGATAAPADGVPSERAPERAPERASGAAARAARGAPAETPAGAARVGAGRPEDARQRDNLPVPTTSFVGRRQELAEITRLLEGGGPGEGSPPRLVTLTGSGGCGKTRLALQVAAGLAERHDLYPDGVWIVELAALADAALLPQAVATTLRLRESPGRTATESLVVALASRRALLLLDNCEHLLDPCARLADAILHRCAGVRILATSRQALGMAGEAAYRVPSLALPEAGQLPESPEGGPEAYVAGLAGFEAIRLFVERASFGQPGFRLTAQNAPAIVQVCRRLDGIPLAIELASSRLAVLSPAQLADRLDDRFRLLTSGNRTAPPRHQTLRAVVDWSYGLLVPAERAVFARLSVFAGGFTLEAAEAVAGESGPPSDPQIGQADGQEPAAPAAAAVAAIRSEDVLGLLAQLVDKSLVVAGAEAGGQTRYRLPDTLRQYAQERLAEAGDRQGAAVTRRRHGAFFLDLAEQAEGALTGPWQAEWLKRLELEHDNLRAALRWAIESGDAETGLRLSAALGRFWAVRGYLREGRGRLAAALDAARSAGAPPSVAQARALYGAGFLAWRQGDAAAARPLLEESVTLGRALGDRRALGYALFYLGLVPQFQGDYPTARRHFEESRASFEAAGDEDGLALALFSLGNLARQEGDATAARALLERSLAMFRKVGDRRGLALPLGYLGRVALSQGDHALARARLEEALAIWREIGETWLIAAGLSSLAEVARWQGDQRQAEALLTQSLDLWRELGSAGTQSQGALHQLGHVALGLGDARRAETLFQESLALAREQGNKRHVAECLAGLADVAAADDQPQRAARFFGAAEALRREVGAALSPADRIDHQRGLARARTALGEDGFQACSDAGAAAPLDAIVADALRGGQLALSHST